MCPAWHTGPWWAPCQENWRASDEGYCRLHSRISPTTKPTCGPNLPTLNEAETWAMVLCIWPNSSSSVVYGAAYSGEQHDGACRSYCTYYNSLVAECGDNQKALFWVVKDFCLSIWEAWSRNYLHSLAITLSTRSASFSSNRRPCHLMGVLSKTQEHRQHVP